MIHAANHAHPAIILRLGKLKTDLECSQSIYPLSGGEKSDCGFVEGLGSGASMKRWCKSVSLTGIALLLSCLLAFAFRVQLLTGLASFLVVDDALQAADMIFVLTGGMETRPFHAAELYQRGLAPLIALSRAEETPTVEMGLYPDPIDVMVSVMKEQGVPDADIIVLPFEGGVSSTHDEAVALSHYVDVHPVERVILVTSAFHTRRGQWMLERELSDSSVTLQVSAAPEWNFDETNWWQREQGLISFANEYLKLLYYLVRYR